MRWLERLKLLVTDVPNWKMVLYMISQLVLGTLCFMVIVTLLSVSLAFMALPIVDAVMGERVPFIITNGSYWLTTSGYLPIALIGFLLRIGSMHLFKWIGPLHGKYAKMLLVTD